MMGDIIAWYASYTDSKEPVEFGLNVKWFKNGNDLSGSVKRMVENH